ncbi:MAG TPA: Amuc_1100 family pilus-like protein [Luteolibacter sp.]
MSWIKDNKFMAALVGGTLVAAILLYFAGTAGAKKYDEAKEKYDADAADAANFEKLPLYPSTNNKNEKSKALGDYRKAVESLQRAFEPFSPKEIKDITPQEFTSRLLAANTEVRKAFEDAGTTVPEPFFMGFERYRTTLASGKTTGILDYQLVAIKKLMLSLAKAKPTDLKNLHRPSLPEEDGQVYKPEATVVARPLPLEITFTGTEKSAREFLSAVAKPDSHYFVIRSLRITNLKKEPPRAADAHFEKSATAKPAPGAGEIFGDAFVLPSEGAPAAADAPAAPKPADSSRILAQVLGNEQIQVFVRLDLLEFMPAKKLP